jgi:hypothetical protein
MKNQYHYNCPVSWDTVPNEYRWLTLSPYLQGFALYAHINTPRIAPNTEPWRNNDDWYKDDAVELKKYDEQEVPHLRRQIGEAFIITTRCLWERPKND